MVWIYIIAGELFKANFILTVQNIQFGPVYFATILIKNIIHIAHNAPQKSDLAVG